MGKDSKTIIITAGTKRLGFAFAQTSLALGYSVLLHYRSSKGDSEQLLKEYPDKVHFIQQDLEQSPEQIIEKALSLNNEVVGLVNNASQFSTGNLSQPDHFLNTLSINTITPLQLSNAFYKMVSKGWIINITDANIHHTNLTYQNYRISKLFLEEITRQQAVLYAPEIRVNAIAPGAMLPSKGKEAYFATLSEKIPLRATGNLSALTSAYSFLVQNDYITGQVLRVDGGWSLI